MRQIILECDDDDYRDLQREIAHQQAMAHRMKLSDGSPGYPDGSSNVAAVCLAEAVRALWDFRDLEKSRNA